MSMSSLAGMGWIALSQAISGVVIKSNLTGLFVIAGCLLVMMVIWTAFQPGQKTLSEQVLDSQSAT